MSEEKAKAVADRPTEEAEEVSAEEPQQEATPEEGGQEAEAEAEKDGKADEKGVGVEDYLAIEPIEGYDKDSWKELLESETVAPILDTAAQHKVAPEVVRTLIEQGIAALRKELEVDPKAEVAKLGPRAVHRIAAAQNLLDNALGSEHWLTGLLLSSADGIEAVEKIARALGGEEPAKPTGAATMSAADLDAKISELIRSPDYRSNATKQRQVYDLIRAKMKMEGRL